MNDRFLLAARLLLAAALSLAAPTTRGTDTTPAPLSPDDAVAAMRLPGGFHGTLVAAEPNVVQPISMCFDDRGRLWVAEALNYGKWQETGHDRIVILEDTKGTGHFDSRKVFYEGFNYITGIQVGFGGVWVISPPKLYFVPDRDGDDKPDGPPQVLFDGFGYKESRHNLANGFSWGPDGWLYAGHGRTSPSDVGRPGASAAERVHCDGGVYRIHPTKLIFENFSDGTTNPWGVDFDKFGQAFVSNCVNPHLFHMVQGGHYEPSRNRPSSMYAYEWLPTCADHLHYVDNPKSLRGETADTLALGGGHAHCGTLIYKGGEFPPEYDNSVYLCNIHGRRINHDLLRPKGSGYVASHGPDFMLAGDPWFMGVTLRTGPDGSVFVSDWSDTGECHTYQPHVDTGRIYSIAFGHPARAKVDLAKQSDEELARLQLDKNDWYAEHARRRLQERAAKAGWQGKAVYAILQEMLTKQTDEALRLRALWTLHATGGLDDAHLISLLDDKAEHIRSWSVQLLCENLRPPKDAVAKFAALAKTDPSPVVRLALAAALQRMPLDGKWPIAAALVGHAEDVGDVNLPLMDWYGIEPLVVADGERAFRLANEAQIPLVRRFIARRFVEKAVGEKKPVDPLVSALAVASAEAQHDLLVGAREGLSGTKNLPMPEDWPAVAAKLNSAADATTRDAANTLSVIFGDRDVLAKLRAMVESTAAEPAARRAALQTLVDKRLPDLPPLLQKLLDDPVVRLTAIRGLAAYADATTPEKILSRYAGFSPEEKRAAVATLAARKEFALRLLDAVENKTVPRADVSAFAARQIFSLSDPKVTERLEKVWGPVRTSTPEKQERLAKYIAQLNPEYMREADPPHGRLLFSQTCQHCHTLFGVGAKIGPDLTGANRDNLSYLLSKVIDPSAQINREFRMSVVVTTDGRVISGIVVEHSANRVVVQTATDRVVLAPADVDAIKESNVSMMPEGQLDHWRARDVRDLVSYLQGKGNVPLPDNAKP